MGFSVDVAALAGLPRQLDRLSEDATAGRNYVERYTQLSTGEGIINLIMGGHREATRKVSTFFRILDSVADGQSRGVGSALIHYRNTDLAAAAAFDAKLPKIAWPNTEPDMGSLGFADRGEPQNGMTPPPQYNEFQFEMKWSYYLSPTEDFRHLIWKVTGLAVDLGILDRQIDPFVEWLKPWLGDWDGFRRCADVHETLANACLTMSANVRSGSIDSQFVWTGNAADSFRRDQFEVGSALNHANLKLHELAAEYRSVAENTLKLAEAVAELVAVAADIAAMALPDLLAARGGPGAAVAVHVASGAIRIWRVIEIAMKILDCIKIAESGAKAFTVGIEGFNVIDPKGALSNLATRETAGASLPTGGGGKVPSYT
jgi:hypothetical protein